MCNGVRFTIHGAISDIVFCHCSQCRKVQGSAFATNGVVNRADFKLIKGESLLTSFETSPGKKKYFCNRCGSPIYSDNTQLADVIRVRLGTIESDISERPQRHIYVASKANWETICDDLPQYDALPGEA